MRTHVVTIGGGTGQFHVLRALMRLAKNKELSITAIPTTIDNGGSSGILRLDYQIVAPGDISQCIFGLHPEPDEVAWIFDHRFNGGFGHGHTMRNLIVAAAFQKFGVCQKALDVIQGTFKLQGVIAPVTFSLGQLHARLNDDSHLQSEEEIYTADISKSGGIKKMWIEPEAEANEAAFHAIGHADVLIVCPGTLCCSIVPNFLVRGVKEALLKSRAKKIYVSNLMNRLGHIDESWTVLDYLEFLEQYLEPNFFGAVIANTEHPTEEQERIYKDEKVTAPLLPNIHITDRILIGAPLLMHVGKKARPSPDDDSDELSHLRASVRHDPVRLAAALAMVM